jgi:2-dehydro-3-deoxygalactonokinase
MKEFLSCDWGTTSLRIRLVEIKSCKVLQEEKSSQGIAETFNLWQEAIDTEEEKRAAFYLNIIAGYIEKIEAKMGHSLDGVKLIVSGMASSTIGIIDIPYKSVPVAIDGSDLKTVLIPATHGFNHDVLVISGVCTDDDVMRGEETQLIGCIDISTHEVKNELYIFPGTHSKHVTVKNNRIVGIKTYMTGEFFALLTQKSILKNSVDKDNILDLASFKKGVKDAAGSNLLHSVFKIRTNQLFGTASKKENFNYLSGLLIGTELKDLRDSDVNTINLVCSSNLEIYYGVALNELGLSKTINIFPPVQADETAVRGHFKIGRQLKIF